MQVVLNRSEIEEAVTVWVKAQYVEWVIVSDITIHGSGQAVTVEVAADPLGESAADVPEGPEVTD